jgi:flagellar FliL protein
MSETEVAPTQVAPTSMKKAIIVAAIFAIVGGAAGAAFIGPRIARSTAKAPVTDSSKVTEGSIHLIENLVLNPAGTSGTRFLMAAIAIETKSSAENDRMNKRDAELRDVILAVLGARTIDQLSSLADREPLKKEVMDSVNAMFGPGVARSVYFPQFVIQ